MSQLSSLPQKVLFLLLMEEPPPATNFSLKNLPGESKIDVVSRLILTLFPSSLTWSRPVFQTIFIQESPYLLEVTALPIKEDPYDEVAVASFIRAAMNNEPLPAGCEISWQECSSLEGHFQTLIAQNYHLFHLTESGSPLKDFIPRLSGKSPLCFILGGRRDFSEELAKLLTLFGATKLTLGKKSYLASTCTAYLCYVLEKFSLQKSVLPK